MVFSSIPFLYYFLPIFFIIYFAVPKKVRNIVLLVASLYFYFHGEQGYVLLLIFSSISDYIIGRIIDKHRGKRIAKTALIISLIVNLSLLGFFKYSDFIITNVNAISGLSVPLLYIHLPLGISFYTFQTMSYTIDIYRGDAKVQHNPLNFAAYVSMFPQLVAGPIVRYHTIAAQLTDRKHTWENFSYGVTRFIIGLGKKVMIANTLGELNKAAISTGNPSVLFYWLAIISFMLQIYFDFSAYSDMAIGLGRILGFKFLENFNYPYIAKSITEFWQRWHISMGTWFREYIYIPLGGNRVSRIKWVRNIAIVWLVTGLWHGAAWNFIFWGLYFGIILAIEKLLLMRYLEKTPAALRHIYTLLIVTISFVIFHLESIAGITEYLKGMTGLMGVSGVNNESLYYLQSYAFVLMLAVFGATPVLRNLVNKVREHPKWGRAVEVIIPVFNTALLIVVTAYLVDDSFNPFLYFRF